MSNTITPTENSIPAARPAATVMLLREGASGMEIFMQKRNVYEGDRFAGALVFPGGKVEEQDRDPALREYSRMPHNTDETQHHLRIAAVREAFEECGVLLARPRGEENFISGERLATLQNWRDRLNAGEVTLLDFLRSENLELAGDALVHFANWITAEVAIKRFDTHFYLVHAPADQQLLHDDRETTESLWIEPTAAVAAGYAKQYNIVFPTRCNLEKLALNASVAAALQNAASKPVPPLITVIEKREDGVYVVLPKDSGYPNYEVKVSQ
jgi:8-oxo-dGTP pyrophosphatase MutT (NUDIX family)